MNILTVNLLFSTVVFAIAAKLYLIPMLPRLEPRSVVLPILLLHALRHLGLMFLAPGAVSPGLPAQFAYPAAFGDLIAAVLALIALAAVVRRSRFARPLVALFNVEGTLDLLLAISLATIYGACNVAALHAPVGEHALETRQRGRAGRRRQGWPWLGLPLRQLQGERGTG